MQRAKMTYIRPLINSHLPQMDLTQERARFTGIPNST